jgi:hypothetical protein
MIYFNLFSQEPEITHLVFNLTSKFHRFFLDDSFLFCQLCKLQKKGAPDSQLQVIKFTSCSPMVIGPLQVLRLVPKPGRHNIAEILLKLVLNTKNQSNQSQFSM